jgi:hypothetical protein
MISRTGTSIAVLGESRNGFVADDAATTTRPANLEDVFVLLTGERIE